MKPKARDVVAFTIDAFRDGIRLLYRDALPEVFTDEFFLSIDERVRREFGGTAPYVCKTPQRAEAAKAKAVHDFARGTPMREVVRTNGISRASMYRVLGRKASGGHGGTT